MDFENKRKCNI